MGSKSSKGRVTDHVAFSTSPDPIPNIVVTKPTPLNSPDSPKPFAPPPSPTATYYYPEQPPHRAPPPTPMHISSMDLASAETSILSGTPPLDRPPDRPPPPPPVDDDDIPPPAPLHPAPFPKITDTPMPVPSPRTGLPTIKRNIIYAKDKINQYEALNTTDRKKENGYVAKTDDTSKYYSIKDAKPSEYSSRFKPFTSSSSKSSPTMPTSATTPAVTPKLDNYPIYNPVADYSFKSGTSFQQGAFPIESNRINIGFCGRKGCGKSTLINALRGIQLGEPQSAGRTTCSSMEPFRFLQEDLQNIVLWEIPYPQAFNTVVDIYDRNMSFDKMYETHKLHLFTHIFVLIPDGATHNDDVSFSRIVHARRSQITFISSKTDDDLDAESRELGRFVNDNLKREYETRARSVFLKAIHQRGQILREIDLWFISSSVIKDLLCGTTGHLHYKMDEMDLINSLKLKIGCHYALEAKRKREREDVSSMSSHYEETDIYLSKRPDVYKSAQLPKFAPPIVPTKPPEKATTLVDAGFEILYGTDDRVFGNMEPNTTVRRAGKTVFNYGFVGGSGVGKSAMINALRGMSSRHPLAAGKSRAKAGSCERFEFEDDLLKYNVTLWELHYPKKINSFFEFIDRNNFCHFTAIFVLIDGVPTDQDLAFSKIAHRRNASVVFLSSKSDKKLSTRSRSDEIPVCDLLKQRFVDKGIARFDRALAVSAPELSGRVHTFFVSAPVFHALRKGDPRGLLFILHERAVFDFLKQKRIIAELLDTPNNLKEGMYANVNTDTAGVIQK